MSQIHYCNKCGLSIAHDWSEKYTDWLIDNNLENCKECDPEAWKKADKYEMPVRRVFRQNSKMYKNRTQWSKWRTE